MKEFCTKYRREDLKKPEQILADDFARAFGGLLARMEGETVYFAGLYLFECITDQYFRLIVGSEEGLRRYSETEGGRYGLCADRFNDYFVRNMQMLPDGCPYLTFADIAVELEMPCCEETDDYFKFSLVPRLLLYLDDQGVFGDRVGTNLIIGAIDCGGEGDSYAEGLIVCVNPPKLVAHFEKLVRDSGGETNISSLPNRYPLGKV